MSRRRPHLSYAWRPDGAQPKYREGPQVGDLVPLDHMVFRVVEINPRDPVDWSDEDRETVQAFRNRPDKMPRVMILRPLGVDDRNSDEHYRLGGESRFIWHVYPNEHYPTCAKCHEPLPCREQMAERISAAAGKRMGRFDLAGKCPSCEEVVTRRQESITFPDNLVVMFGPPVTFHLRRKCRHGAVQYEKDWVAADPDTRNARLSCPGTLINHNDGTYECLPTCPGPRTEHQCWTVCDCVECHNAGRFGCHPSPTARNRAGSPTGGLFDG